MTQVKNVIKDNYNMMLLNDFLREKIKDAGFNGMEISKIEKSNFFRFVFLLDFLFSAR